MCAAERADTKSPQPDDCVCDVALLEYDRISKVVLPVSMQPLLWRAAVHREVDLIKARYHWLWLADSQTILCAALPDSHDREPIIIAGVSLCTSG
jgi:hypothetical protein